MATQRNAFLINNLRPDLVLSNVFEVREGAVRITAGPFVDTEYVVIEKQVSPKTGSFEAVWTPLVRQGQVVRLSGNNIEHIELLAGIYRVVFNLDAVSYPELVVWMQEDQSGLDSRLMYTLPAYNASFNGSVTGRPDSPALVNSRHVEGKWIFDPYARKYQWIESVIDTSTGDVLVTRTLTRPGGTEDTEANIAYPPETAGHSCERILPLTMDNTQNENINFENYNTNNYVLKQITIIVDTGEFIFSYDGEQISMYEGETFVFAPTAPLGGFAGNIGGMTLATASGQSAGTVTDSARVLLQVDAMTPNDIFMDV